MNTTQDQGAGEGARAGGATSRAGNGDAMRQETQPPEHGAEELRANAAEVVTEAAREGQAHVDQYRDVAARKVDTIAESVKAAAARLQEGDVGQWSTQIAAMAESMSRFSRGLREKSADEVMHDVSRLARENPAIFVGGAVAIGFALTRLMRASAQARDPREVRRQAGAAEPSGERSSSGDDADSRSTSNASGYPRRADSAPGGGHARSPGFMGTGGASAGSSGSMGAGSNSWSSGVADPGMAGGGQAEQSGYSGTGGSQGNGNLGSGASRHDGNDRSTAS